MKRNGEAIYKSKPWIHQNDTLTSDVWYTADKKVTKTLDPETNDPVKTQFIYATVLKYPYKTNFIEFGSLHSSFNDKIPIQLLGYPDKIAVRTNFCLRSNIFL